MVDSLIPMVVAGLRAAAQLDCRLDIDAATQALLALYTGNPGPDGRRRLRPQWAKSW
ncbi:hypothetical protein IU479_17905 [Nocardia abscessus]|uniref:hypothetical protein n=1 Tax=Nocardia TaxID=1817 RepID=UPI001895221D|nr:MULTISPECIES: hypothetical protein [Nocardia]MBF6219983.1 hypothetical protein [Nocardia abscessus]MDE1674841.1 hypothetical protein [Nocardia gipuzkoensis]